MEWLSQGGGKEHPSVHPQPGINPVDGRTSALQDQHSQHDLQEWFSLQKQQTDAGTMLPFPAHQVCQHFLILHVLSACHGYGQPQPTQEERAGADRHG